MINNLNGIGRRMNGASWPSAFGALDAQIEALFADWPSLFERGSSATGRPAPAGLKSSWYQKDDAFMARLDLPGVKPEALEVEWKGDVVLVNATRHTGVSVAQPHSKSSKFEYSSVIPAPEGIDPERISATYENGVLSIVFPKAEKLKPRRINVNAAE